MLGNIKFIGELGKLEILAESILHKCIQQLLVRHGDDPSEDLECLCQIMRTCGRILDTSKGQGLMDQYFDRMKQLIDNGDLQPRIRFMLKDVIDLRQDGWVPRKATVVEGPMPINQIRPADDDRSGFRRDHRPAHHDHRDSDRSSLSELFRHPLKTRGGIDDMLMGMNLATTSPNLIPTNAYGPNGYGNQREGAFRGHNNQRSGYNNYNSQRGQYKHNQNNANSQYNNQSNKEIAPRFKKNNLFFAKEEIGEVELRPSSMLYNKANNVKTNNIMNSRSMEPTFTQTMKPNSTPLHKEPLPIKQVSADKPKQSKKDKVSSGVATRYALTLDSCCFVQGPTKDEVLKKFTSLLEEFWKGDVDLKQAVNSYKEHKVPDKFAKDVILRGLSIALDKTGKVFDVTPRHFSTSLVPQTIFSFQKYCYRLQLVGDKS